MRLINRNLMGVFLCLISQSVLAQLPKQLTIHNTTDAQLNTFFAGVVPSPFPCPARNDSHILWSSIRMACFGHTVNSQCPTLIKIGTDTAMPLPIGTIQLDLNSGNIIPAQVSANGYTLTVNSPGDITISKNHNANFYNH